MAGISVRLGFVANALRLPESSPSHTATVAALERLPDAEARFGRLRTLARLNLENTLRILRENAYDRIHLYRLTSKLVPLATHPLVGAWEYWLDLADELARIGEFVRANGMRLSAHPDHYALLNSPRHEVTEASLKDLLYHHRIFQAMGLPDSRLIMHVGGGYRDPEAAKRRFLDNFQLLPREIAHRIALENDDRSFNAEEVLELCRILRLPMVLDTHHHAILPGKRRLEVMLPEVIATWGDERPKFHFSSPKSETEPRSHADYIDAEEFVKFLRTAARAGRDFDVMIEAKAKDLAVLRLGEEMWGRTGIRVVSKGEMEML